MNEGQPAKPWQEEHNAWDIIQPDTIVPSQYVDQHRARELTPEQRLALAVLEDGIDCFRGNARNTQTSARAGDYTRVTDYRRFRLREEARRWLLDDKNWGPFSFIALCELFNIDMPRFRRQIMKGELFDG